MLLCIAVLTGIVCALPGAFLLLRGIALLSDAMSHTMLFGIVGMFLCTHQLHAPSLFLGAAIIAWITVMATEQLMICTRMYKDAAIGLIYPFFFSLGVILMSQYTRYIHLDIDMVMLGELALTPWYRMIIYGIDCGPYALWVLLILLGVNILFLSLFFKELIAMTFDPIWSTVSGCSSRLIIYGLIGITCISAVGSFNIVGSMVVVSLMIVPCAGAYLIAQTVFQMLVYSIFLGSISCMLGCIAALWTDVTIAGLIAVVNGIVFLVILLGAPKKGLVSRSITHYYVKKKMRALLLCYIIQQRDPEHKRTTIHQLIQNSMLDEEMVKQGVCHAIQLGYVQRTEDVLQVTSRALKELLFI